MSRITFINYVNTSFTTNNLVVRTPFFNRGFRFHDKTFTCICMLFFLLSNRMETSQLKHDLPVKF
jgi:hypothetical protein